MVPYVLGVTPADVLLLFCTVSRILEELGVVELPNNEELSCHVLARAIALRMYGSFPSVNLRTQTGYFNGPYDHSWICITSKESPGAWILDVYPVGGIAGQKAGALLWDWRVAGNLYRKKKSVRVRVVGQPQFLSTVRFTSARIAETKRALGL